MADPATSHGRLISVDGSRGKDVARAADALADRLQQRGVDAVISRWDASGLFGELVQDIEPAHHVSPRTLSLVFAADLAFRLRWEIRPGLDAGRVVIAASYVSTAMALGSAAGLAQDWIRNLLRFAPAPYARGLAREGKAGRGWKGRLDRGYPEYYSALMERSLPTFTSRPVRQAMAAALAAGGRRLVVLSNQGIADVADTVIRSRPAASPRSASRRRNARS